MRFAVNSHEPFEFRRGLADVDLAIVFRRTGRVGESEHDQNCDERCHDLDRNTSARHADLSTRNEGRESHFGIPAGARHLPGISRNAATLSWRLSLSRSLTLPRKPDPVTQ